MSDQEIQIGQSTQFSVNELVIVTKAGKIDITSIFEEINIFDSIFLPVMNGSVLIKDAIGLSGKLFFDGSESLLIDISKDSNSDIASFKNNNEWLVNHPVDSLMFKDVEAIWKELATVYSSNFKSLVYKNFPNESEILATLTQIQERLKAIEWTIVIK